MLLLFERTCKKLKIADNEQNVWIRLRTKNDDL